jgi:hypothetical protein
MASRRVHLFVFLLELIAFCIALGSGIFLIAHRKVFGTSTSSNLYVCTSVIGTVSLIASSFMLADAYITLLLLIGPERRRRKSKCLPFAREIGHELESEAGVINVDKDRSLAMRKDIFVAEQ